jgi:heptosyltransferase-2
VPETVAAMSLAQACVGNDTGATNIAAAMGTPTFVLLGPRPPLAHDPETMRLLQAASLSDIQPADVAARLAAAPG